jgi:hypothetical protein
LVENIIQQSVGSHNQHVAGVSALLLGICFLFTSVESTKYACVVVAQVVLIMLVALILTGWPSVVVMMMVVV